MAQLVRHSGIPHRFEECEYALPADAGMASFREVRARVLARWRHVVGWRLLYRTVSADPALISAAPGRDTVTISLHQNSTLPWWDYFADIEPIFRAHGGRLHWAKKHTSRAGDLAPLYPRWRDFLARAFHFQLRGFPAVTHRKSGDPVTLALRVEAQSVASCRGPPASRGAFASWCSMLRFFVATAKAGTRTHEGRRTERRPHTKRRFCR